MGKLEKKVPSSFRLRLGVVKTLKELKERGIKTPEGIKKVPLTDIVEQAIIEFAKKNGAKIFTRCKYASEFRGKQTFCERLGKYVDVSFCLDVCKAWENMPNRIMGV